MSVIQDFRLDHLPKLQTIQETGNRVKEKAMQKLELFDETFDPDRTATYELSIQVSLSGFSLCIKDLTRNLFVGLASCPFNKPTVSPNSWPEQVAFITSSYGWVSKSFKTVIFSYESRSFTLAPANLFEPNKAKTLLSLTTQIQDLDEVRYNSATNDSVSIFSIPSLLVTSWLKVQSKSKIVAFCDSAIQFHLLSIKNEKDNSITLSLANDFGVAIASNGEKIQHCAALDISSIDDITYHLLNICKGLGFSPSNTVIRILGQHDKKTDLQVLIGRFFKNVSPNSTIEQSHFSYLIGKYKIRFANLFSQSLCV